MQLAHPTRFEDDACIQAGITVTVTHHRLLPADAGANAVEEPAEQRLSRAPRPVERRCIAGATEQVNRAIDRLAWVKL